MSDDMLLKITGDGGLENTFTHTIKDPEPLHEALRLALRKTEIIGYVFDRHSFEFLTLPGCGSIVEDEIATDDIAVRCEFGFSVDVDTMFKLSLRWLQTRAKWPKKEYTGDGENRQHWCLERTIMHGAGCRLSTTWVYFGK